MFEIISLTFYTLREAIGQKAVIQLLHNQIFFARVVIPVTIDLAALNGQDDPFQNSNYRFIELTEEALNSRGLIFPVRSRYFRALVNINKGSRGFVLLKDNTVIGDIWCVAPHNANIPVRHPDLKMLKITCANKDAYVMDMFIDPAYRGKNLAVPVHRSLQNQLKREGWLRIYAYYYEDNLSSKWMHLMLKCQELPKLRAYRYFSIVKTYQYNLNNLSA